MGMPGLPGTMGAKHMMLRYEGFSSQGYSYGTQPIQLEVVDAILLEEIKYVQVRRQFSALPAKVQQLLKANKAFGQAIEVVLLEAVMR